MEIWPSHHQGCGAGDASPDTISSHWVEVDPTALAVRVHVSCHIPMLWHPLSPPAIAGHDTTPILSLQAPAAAGNPRGFPSPGAERPPARCTPWTPACDGQQNLPHPAPLWDALLPNLTPIKAPSPILRHLCDCFKALTAGSARAVASVAAKKQGCCGSHPKRRLFSLLPARFHKNKPQKSVALRKDVPRSPREAVGTLEATELLPASEQFSGKPFLHRATLTPCGWWP